MSERKPILYTATRLVHYVGSRQWLDRILAKSLHGTQVFDSNCRITVQYVHNVKELKIPITEPPEPSV